MPTRSSPSPQFQQLYERMFALNQQLIAGIVSLKNKTNMNKKTNKTDNNKNKHESKQTNINNHKHTNTNE